MDLPTTWTEPKGTKTAAAAGLAVERARSTPDWAEVV